MERWTLRLTIALSISLLAACSLPAPAAPQVGYVYPAGGQQGTSFTVEVGGQDLRDVDLVHVSGRGVRASVVEYVPELDDQELRGVQSFMRDLVRRRWSVQVLDDAARDEPPLPDHPWLRDIDSKSPAELARLQTAFFDPKKQPNDQIAEHVTLEVTIAPDAATGDRELRLVSPQGMSNPLCFQVGALPELCEKEFATNNNPAAQVVEPPALLNGQIMPGEVDHIRLRLREGQRIVIRLAARHLIPYLADAVPGWFQATLSLHDPAGEEVAYVDDFRFDPDPVLLHEVPADGVYELIVRDAIFRGREDFVYRIAIGELPFVTECFPLGGREGSPTVASIDGWNLPSETLTLDTAPGDSLRHATVGAGAGMPDEVVYAVDSLPEVIETEPNDDRDDAQQVAFPQIVNGRIGDPGDVDSFRFDGQAGERIVAEIFARRLDSPMDSVLRLVGPDGAEVVLNDDWEDPERGLITHHADSRVEAELPADGEYLIEVSDAQHDGGKAHAYRLHVRAAQPDFALRLVPSGINVPAGRSATAEVHALRREGFDGGIALRPAEGPEGFTMPDAVIPAGETSAQVTIQAPAGAPRMIAPLRVEGSAQIAGETVTRPAVPAEDMMQAFLWRFLVPRQELLVAVTGSRPVPAIWRPLVPGLALAAGGPVQIPLGGTVQVRIETPETLPNDAQTPREALRFRMCNHPRGVTLREATVTPEGVALTLKADANMCLPGDEANVIVEAFTEPRPGDEAGAGGVVALGVLPAIPFTVVR